MTNETTPDAVERQYQDSDGNPCDLVTLCRREPEWAANRIDTLLAERARHAEEVARLEAVHLSALETIEAWKLASGLECGGDPDGVTPAGMRRYWEGVEADRDSLRDQLRRAEGERDAERKHASEMEERALDLVRDLRLANVELASLRSLLPDVRACVEWMLDPAAHGEYAPTEKAAAHRIGDVPMTDPTIPELVARLRELHAKLQALQVGTPEFTAARQLFRDVLQLSAPEILDALERGTEAFARAWEEGAEAAFDAEASPDSDYIKPLFGRALDEFYASNPYRTKGVGDE